MRSFSTHTQRRPDVQRNASRSKLEEAKIRKLRKKTKIGGIYKFCGNRGIGLVVDAPAHAHSGPKISNSRGSILQPKTSCLECHRALPNTIGAGNKWHPGSGERRRFNISTASVTYPP